jgi:hypothetical protein
MNTITTLSRAILQKRMNRKYWVETILTVILAASALLLSL